MINEFIMAKHRLRTGQLKHCRIYRMLKVYQEM